jgi:hypothetical protein
MQRSAFVVLALAAAACGTPSTSTPAATAPVAEASAPGAKPADHRAGGGPAGAPAGMPAVESSAAAALDGGDQSVTGVVAETINSGGYTYVRLTGAKGDTWVAASEMPIEKGAKMVASVSVVMQNFHSRTLNRDFPQIFFVTNVALNGVAVASNADAAAAAGIPAKSSPGVDMPAMANSHDDAVALGGSPKADATKLVAKVDPAPGGLTVFQVWEKRASLSGKPVVVRGRVVKANYEIMGSNWYHVQDGSGNLEAGTHDLTVTSNDRANVGDVVTITGPITLGKDFGAGYAYDVMVEKASIRK